jgi:hypothetical protein
LLEIFRRKGLLPATSNGAGVPVPVPPPVAEPAVVAEAPRADGEAPAEAPRVDSEAPAEPPKSAAYLAAVEQVDRIFREVMPATEIAVVPVAAAEGDTPAPPETAQVPAVVESESEATR